MPRTGRLIRSCDARFRAWGVPEPFDIAALAGHLGRRRGRPVHLLAAPLGPPGPSGILLALPDRDVIAYDAGAGPAHRDHIIAHELAHLGCGHPGAAAALLPGLDPRLVRDMLGRAAHGDRNELEAEVLASTILRRMRRRRWYRDYRSLRCLYPLWRDLCRRVPSVALVPPPSALRDRLRIRHLDFWLARRVVEIQDARRALRAS